MVDDPDEGSDGFKALFQSHFPAVYGYALRRCATPDSAADVAAETFTVAWRRRTEMPDSPEARLWLYGVARRILGTAHRGDRRHSALVQRSRTATSWAPTW